MGEGNADPSATVVIAKSRSSMLKTIPGGLMLAAASYYTTFQYPPDSSAYLVAEIGIWFFGLGSIIAALSLVMPRSHVRLSPDAFTYRNPFFGIGPVPWSAVTDVSITHRKSVTTGAATAVVAVMIADKYKYMTKRQPRGSDEAAAFAKITRRPITLVPSSLGTTAPELAQALQVRVDAFGARPEAPPSSPEGQP